MHTLSRRTILSSAVSFGIVLQASAQDKSSDDPWPPDRLVEPSELAMALKSSDFAPTIISVVFPVLYRQRHIPHALAAGPTSKPEGIAALRAAVSSMPKDTHIVIYCGCCPMEHCPNIRPAYTTLKNAGFGKVHVLNLRNNLHTDWTAKGYPVEPAV